jgi:hypothetical protein
MRNCLLTLFLIASATAGQAQNAPPAWLAGCWELQTPTRITTEMWMAPAGGMMLGASRTVAAGKVREFEQLRMTMSGDTLVYTASPSGQTTTSFKSTSSLPNLIRFENPAHDFPKAIQYHKVSADSIVARIEGPGKDGTTRGIDFPMKRVSCMP